MGKGEPLRLKSKLLCFSVLFVSMALWGCARSAPTLPTVESNSPPVGVKRAQSDSDSLIECAKLSQQIKILERDENALNVIIQSDRGKNQMAGFLGGMFIVPYLAMEGHEEEKRRLDEVQVKRDGIYAEMKGLRCPSPTR